MRAVLAVLVLSLSLAAPIQAATVYFSDFSGAPGSEWSTSATRTRSGETYLAGPSGYGFGNETVTLTLTGLAVGSSATISFDLYVIGSWDGNGLPGNAPAWTLADNWGVKVNGQQEILTNFANYAQDGQTQAYPAMVAPLGAGANNPARTGASAGNHLGYGNGYWGDATYHFAFTVDNLSSSTLTLAFTSYQSEDTNNEGWGLDNVRVDGSAVPLPSSLLLLAPGLFGLIGARRFFGRSIQGI